MRSMFLLQLLILVVAPSLTLAGETSHYDTFWPQWRGPLATGVAPTADPPVEWSEDNNVVWKVEIPGKGSSTPIVWGDTIVVSTAVPTGAELDSGAPAPIQRRGPPGIPANRAQQFTLLALHREDGRVLWKRVLREQRPHEGTHVTGTWASPSPITDGKLIYASFGSFGLYCLDLEGELRWEVDLGDMQTRLAFGEGSSPALHGEVLVVNWDHEGPSFIVALNKHTGQELWRRQRDEPTSWATPLITEVSGRHQVVVNASNRVRSYDLETGEIIWQAAGMTLNAIPSPARWDDSLVVTSGFRGNALLAIRLNEARGDITDTPAISWSLDRDTPYVPSPLLYGGQVYILKTNDAILSSFDVHSGHRHYGPVRIEGLRNVYASPLGAADRIYIAGREGATAVLRHGPEFEVLAVNALDDGFDASPVAVGEDLYLRGHRYLYRISATR